jgi:hypothetical protein
LLEEVSLSNLRRGLVADRYHAEGPSLGEGLPCAWDRSDVLAVELSGRWAQVPILVLVVPSRVLLLVHSGHHVDRRARVVGGLWPVGSGLPLLLDHHQRSHCQSPLYLQVVSSLCIPLECLPLGVRLLLCPGVLDVKIRDRE